MTLLQRLFGLIGTLLGLIGLLISIGAIVGTWLLREQLQVELPNVLEAVESTVSSVDENVDQAKTAVTKAQSGVGTFKDTAEGLKTRVDESQQFDRALLGDLKLEVGDHLAKARNVVNLSRGLVDTLTSTVGRADNVPYVELDDYAPDGPLMTNIQAASDELSAVRATLEKAEQLVDDLGDDPMEQSSRLDEIIELMTGLREQLVKAAELIEQFHEGLGKVQTTVTKVRNRGPQWIDTGAIVATVLFSWMALAQLSLLAIGWHWLRK